jgi:hypothetical protein
VKPRRVTTSLIRSALTTRTISFSQPTEHRHPQV